ncbi:HET-domain-containing protein [Astrocystis sublimbata]|nr:HET-domain-containing protein [Astrocystis sublimbata]
MSGLLYAILSHTWEEDELVYEDIIHGTEESKSQASRDKVRMACTRAAEDNYDYLWIDTCCIDKRSSAELSEAINSMFDWYSNAAVCYAYLFDAPMDLTTEENKAQFSKSKWFRRGWTLQELVAPREFEFYSGSWELIGRKNALGPLLAEITGIDVDILTHQKPLSSASIARRMSWAARREVTRPEDMAYCLMGVFSVNMPMLYGEGAERAFLRLQEELMKESDDQSLFAWVNPSSPAEMRYGLLAPSPGNFLYSHSILPYDDWEARSPYVMTNRGLRINLHLTALDNKQFVAAVDCPSPPDFENSTFLAIYLEKISESDEQYARIKAGTFAMVRKRGALRTIYIRQKPEALSEPGAFPQHIMQIRNIPSPEVYTVKRIITPPGASKPVPEISMKATYLLPKEFQVAFPLPRGVNQLAAGIIFARENGESVIVLVGSCQPFQIGYDARELDVGLDSWNVSFDEMVPLFRPSGLGRIELEYNNIRVSATSVVRSSSKYYIVDIGIEHVKRSERLSETILGAYEVATGSGQRNAQYKTGPRLARMPVTKPNTGAKELESKKSRWYELRYRWSAGFVEPE